jgi:hypothetical protein
LARTSLRSHLCFRWATSSDVRTSENHSRSACRSTCGRWHMAKQQCNSASRDTAMASSRAGKRPQAQHKDLEMDRATPCVVAVLSVLAIRCLSLATRRTTTRQSAAVCTWAVFVVSALVELMALRHSMQVGCYCGEHWYHSRSTHLLLRHSMSLYWCWRWRWHWRWHWHLCLHSLRRLDCILCVSANACESVDRGSMLGEHRRQRQCRRHRPRLQNTMPRTKSSHRLHWCHAKRCHRLVLHRIVVKSGTIVQMR